MTSNRDFNDTQAGVVWNRSSGPATQNGTRVGPVGAEDDVSLIDHPPARQRDQDERAFDDRRAEVHGRRPRRLSPERLHRRRDERLIVARLLPPRHRSGALRRRRRRRLRLRRHRVGGRPVRGEDLLRDQSVRASEPHEDRLLRSGGSGGCGHVAGDALAPSRRRHAQHERRHDDGRRRPVAGRSARRRRRERRLPGDRTPPSTAARSSRAAR